MRMNTYVVNIVGLCLDILGVIIIFIYGLPSDVSKDGYSTFTIENPDPIEVKKFNRYKLMSRIGLGLILLGFVVQVISNIISLS